MQWAKNSLTNNKWLDLLKHSHIKSLTSDWVDLHAANHALWNHSPYTYIFKELNEVLMLVTGGVLHIDIIVGVSGLSPTLLLPGSFNIMISHCIIFDNQSITFSLTMSPSSLYPTVSVVPPVSLLLSSGSCATFLLAPWHGV